LDVNQKNNGPERIGEGQVSDGLDVARVRPPVAAGQGTPETQPAVPSPSSTRNRTTTESLCERNKSFGGMKVSGSYVNGERVGNDTWRKVRTLEVTIESLQAEVERLEKARHDALVAHSVEKQEKNNLKAEVERLRGLRDEIQAYVSEGMTNIHEERSLRDIFDRWAT
jgi:hypothetical protein